jgi:hypothetical protein
MSKTTSSRAKQAAKEYEAAQKRREKINHKATKAKTRIKKARSK